MTRLFAIMALLCVGSQLAGAFNAPQDDKAYYYFRDEKIELNVNKERIYVYFRNEPDVASELIERYGLRPTDRKAAYYQCLAGEKTYSDEIASQEFVVDKDRYADVINNVKEHPMVLSVQRVFGIDTPIPTIDVFYVNLKSQDYYEDMVLLSERTSTQINGNVFNDWYEIRTTVNSESDALGCSNIFYESGICKEVDPGFQIKYKLMTTTVTDTDYSEQWAIDNEGIDIHVADAWNITKGGEHVTVAVFDTGINDSHAEFAGTQFAGFYNTRPNEFSLLPHGTNVTGIIASNHNQGRIAGVAPGVKIMGVLSPLDSLITSRELANGFYWAAYNGADVINCSWGESNPNSECNSPMLLSAIDYALTEGRGGKGCVVVFASGNDGLDHCACPGNSNNDILVVGAISKNNGVCEFSNYGEDLDVVAPGDDILTTTMINGFPEVKYDTVSGTSFAAPHVSGIAALILSAAPYLTGRQVVELIERSAQKILPEYYDYSYNDNCPHGHWDEKMGYGLVDAYASLVKEYSDDMTCEEDSIIGGIVKISDIELFDNNELLVKSYICTSIDGPFYVDEVASFSVNAGWAANGGN